jgi:mannosyl-3-phosphoglycerate phosphatase
VCRTQAQKTESPLISRIIESQDLLLFTDVDGCLLNKKDYDYRPALPVLDRLKSLQIPVILASSKTATELLELSTELQLNVAPLICENGGQIVWRDPQLAEGESTVTGARRSEILAVLAGLKSVYKFRSFADLGLEGVMQATDLPEDRARKAMDRHSTEPLLWDDHPQAIEWFRKRLQSHSLTLTKGGRFWHVAGATTKGKAMQVVVEKLSAAADRQFKTIAIGDSPIDQSMLDIADYPIAIPAPNGTLNVTVNAQTGVCAKHQGSQGWAQSVTLLLDQLLSHE